MYVIHTMSDLQTLNLLKKNRDAAEEAYQAMLNKCGIKDDLVFKYRGNSLAMLSLFLVRFPRQCVIDAFHHSNVNPSYLELLKSSDSKRYKCLLLELCDHESAIIIPTVLKFLGIRGVNPKLRSCLKLKPYNMKDTIQEYMVFLGDSTDLASPEARILIDACTTYSWDHEYNLKLRTVLCSHDRNEFRKLIYDLDKYILEDRHYLIRAQQMDIIT